MLIGLTPEGVVHSWALGTVVYSAFGAGGYVLVCLYFILGSAVRPTMKILLGCLHDLAHKGALHQQDLCSLHDSRNIWDSGSIRNTLSCVMQACECSILRR